MSLYTKNGDTGFSSTATRKMIPKDSPVFALIGSLEELRSVLGMADAQAHGDVGQIIRSLQQDLTAFLADFSGGSKFPAREKVAEMEKSIDMIMKSFPEDGKLPSADSEGGAVFGLAWAIARRAEREMVSCKQTGGISRDALMWANRLSDFIEALSRLAQAQQPAVHTVPVASAGPQTPAQPDRAAGGFFEKGLWLCRKVMEKAAEIPLPVVTAVCDAGGNPLVLLRADHAFIASTDLATNKAFTSVSLKTTTEDLAAQAAPGAPLYGVQNTNGGRIVIFGGGVPLYLHGVLTGGFGVSGGTGEQDTALGRYAAKIFDQKYNIV